MAGASDYLAKAEVAFATGVSPFPTTSARYLALFTGAPTTDAGTGGTELSGNAYARVQIAGQLAASASWTTSSTTITLSATAPAWLLALGTNGSGANVYDVTSGAQVGTVSSISATTVTLTAAAASASSGSADTLAFSAFSAPVASAGSEPSVTPVNGSNGAAVTFPTATGAWSSICAWGVYDASSGGNLIVWDYMGNWPWVPFSCTYASPGVMTSPAHGFTAGNTVVVSSKAGGALPATSGSWSGLLTVANPTTDTFNVGVNTGTSGDGLVRQVVVYSVSLNGVLKFNANNFLLYAY